MSGLSVVPSSDNFSRSDTTYVILLLLCRMFVRSKVQKVCKY